jgi:hypothetical protein
VTIPDPIPNERLKLSDIPSIEADWHAISSFALAYPGYEIHGFKGCAKFANEGHDGSVDQLRAALFFEQRRWSHFGEHPDEEAMEGIQNLLEGLRRGLSDTT